MIFVLKVGTFGIETICTDNYKMRGRQQDNAKIYVQKCVENRSESRYKNKNMRSEYGYMFRRKGRATTIDPSFKCESSKNAYKLIDKY